MVTAALLAMALSAAPAAASPQSPPPPPGPADVPVSVDHVSRGLQVQEPLRIPTPAPAAEPTFRIEVEGKSRPETALEAVRRELSTNPYPDHADTGLPGIGGSSAAATVDVLPAILGLVHTIQRARYARAERQIHADVTTELAEFCEVNDCSQVNEGLLLPDKP